MNPEFEAARAKFEECTQSIWAHTMSLVALEDELVSCKEKVEIESARVRMDPEVSIGKNEKERDAQFTLIASQDQKYQDALTDFRTMAVVIGQKRADIEREQSIQREWRLVMGFLTAPREV